MGEKRILIDGEEYISSGRAAELVGYSKDYVGQLARGGKIDAKRVGRNWYIREASINKHKLSVHYTLTQPKKSKKEKETEVEKEVEKEVKKEKKDDSGSENVLFSVEKSPRLHVSAEQKPSIEQNEEGATVEMHTMNNTRTSTSLPPTEKQRDESRVPVTPAPKKVVHHDEVRKHVQNRQKSAHDLFPQVTKKRSERDPLIQSDIRYEKAPKAAAISENPKPVDPEAFKSVALRKPILRRNTAVSRTHQAHEVTSPRRQRRTSAGIVPRASVNEQVSVDGVVLPEQQPAPRKRHAPVVESTEQRMEESRARSPRGAVPTNKQVQHDYDEYYDDELEPKSEFSKAVPVIGAIILFTVVAVFYIIFTA